jgi:hypothetical protein
VGTHGRDPCHRGSPDEEVIHWSSAHRDIGDPGDKLSVHLGIAKRETSMSGGLAVNKMESWDSQNWEFRGHMHFGIEKLETPMRDKAAVL